MPISTPSLERLLETDIREPLPSEITGPILSQSPFVPVLNGRDLGLVPGSAIAPGRFYRAGQLNASSAGWEEWLKANVGVIVDFRHSSERERAPEPALGLGAIWHEPKDTHRPDLDIFTGDGSEGWKLMYLKYLVIYAETIRAVLQHVRDERGPILFHCSAGRDRTGVMAGLLHGLAGSPEDVALRDFMFSRIGIEPGRKYIEAHARSLCDEGEPLTEAVVNMISLRPSSWRAFVEGVSEVYGGWEGYVSWLGFAEEDVERMRRSLRGERSSQL